MKKNKQYLFILCGEAFSGKTTLAKKISKLCKAKIIGRDGFYPSIAKILALEDTPEKDDDNLWKNLWPIAVQGVKNWLLLGESVVVDDNCLYSNQREDLYRVAKEAGIKHTLIYLNITTEVLKERKRQNKINKTRHDVPSSWMEEDSNTFERPGFAENPLVFTEKETIDDLLKKINEMI